MKTLPKTIPQTVGWIIRRSLAPVMMALITSANKKGIQFTPQEMSLILDILKEGRSREEQNQIDQMVQMVRTHMKNNT